MRHGLDTHYYFLYGADSSLSGAGQTPSQDIGSGSSALTISANISGLSAGTLYYFEVVASNSAGTTTATPAGSFTTSETMFTLRPNLVGQGTVTGADGKINCTSSGSGLSGTCSASYARG